MLVAVTHMKINEFSLYQKTEEAKQEQTFHI